MSDLPKICAKAAAEIATAGHFGWGNVCLDAGVRIAELEAQAKASEWQPIETAPKDAQSVLLGCIGQLGSVTRCADGYWLQSAYNGNGAWIWPFVHKSPTHWMPMPAPPKSACESA